MIAQVPELWDGGYFYVLPEIVEDESRSPGDVGRFAGARYQDGYVVFRTIDQIIIPEQPVTTAEIADPSKPWGRLGGL